MLYLEMFSARVWEVACYTCSSPLYFGERDNYIDGGAVYKNPSVFAFEVIRDRYYRLQSVPLEGVVSIGDGKLPSVALERLDRNNYYSLFLPSTAVSMY